MALAKLKDEFVPISRFNKGEAGKIFQEVAAKGMKIVLKNNNPECVLLKPEKYEELLEKIENLELYIEAMKRLNKPQQYIAAEDLYKEYGIDNKTKVDKVHE